MKKGIILSLAFIIVALVSGLSGYTYALPKFFKEYTEAYAQSLLIQSKLLSRLPDTADVGVLMDQIELNGTHASGTLKVGLPYASEETAQMVNESLQEWKKAEKKLCTLRSFYVGQNIIKK